MKIPLFYQNCHGYLVSAFTDGLDLHPANLTRVCLWSSQNERSGSGKKKRCPVKTKPHQFNIRPLQFFNSFPWQIKAGQKAALEDELLKHVHIKTGHERHF